MSDDITNSKENGNSMIATFKLKFETRIQRFLWKLGPKNRKYILKLFRAWTLEDDLYEILAEEIQTEINKEIMEVLMRDQ
jgi:hypothetical protein